jgi:hypothetical protein
MALGQVSISVTFLWSGVVGAVVVFLYPAREGIKIDHNLPVIQEGYHDLSQFAGYTRWISSAHKLPVKHEGYHNRSQFAGNSGRIS